MINVSIVVHNTPEQQLEKAINCLQDSGVDKIFIIDNSGHQRLKEVSDKFNKTEYLKVENRGFGAGHNIALKKSIEQQADYHLVMNADVYWKGNIIQSIFQYMEENPDVGLISPKTYYPTGELQYTCRMLPTPQDLFLKRFLPSIVTKKRMRNYLLKDLDHNKEINCPYLLGSFMFFRITALKEIGLFDERFFMYPEDIDITRRMHEKYKTIYWPGVSIIHEHQQASKKNLKMFWIHSINMIKYFNKWGWMKDSKRKVYNNKLLIDNFRK